MWSEWRATPEMGRGLAATASGSVREAFARARTAERLLKRKRFAWLGEDDLGSRPFERRGETVTTVAYYALVTSDEHHGCANRGAAPARTRPRGTLVFVGAEGDSRWTGGMGRQFEAAMLSPFVRHNLRFFTAMSKADDLLFLRKLIEADRVTPLLDRAFPLSQAPDAVRYWEEGRARGKIAITV